jgi:Trk-type K+ transport system membrane component
VNRASWPAAEFAIRSHARDSVACVAFNVAEFPHWYQAAQVMHCIASICAFVGGLVISTSGNLETVRMLACAAFEVHHYRLRLEANTAIGCAASGQPHARIR